MYVCENETENALEERKIIKKESGFNDMEANDGENFEGLNHRGLRWPQRQSVVSLGANAGSTIVVSYRCTSWGKEDPCSGELL